MFLFSVAQKFFCCIILPNNSKCFHLKRLFEPEAEPATAKQRKQFFIKNVQFKKIEEVYLTFFICQDFLT